MITRVQVKNFRSIADADVSLGPLTVFVGRNGAGKSAFVDVLSFVRDALDFGLHLAFREREGFDFVRRWSANKTHDLEICITAKLPEGVHTEYGFVIGGTERKNQFRVKREYLQAFVGSVKKTDYHVIEGVWNKPGIFSGLVDSLQGKPNALFFPSVRYLLDDFVHFENAVSGRTYNIFPNTLRLPQTISPEELLTKNGSNLASVLRDIEKSKRFFPELRSALRRVVDGVADVRVQQLGGYLLVELQHGDLTETGSKNGNAKAQSSAAPWFGLAQESDGTLRMLAMLTALYQQGSGSVVTLEEPENSLHPGALAVLADVIHEASLRRQVIITTQSPDLISHFQPDELRVVERVNGETKIGPLDTVQRKAVIDKLFSSGDLLRVEGLHREPDEAEGVSRDA